MLATFHLHLQASDRISVEAQTFKPGVLVKTERLGESNVTATLYLDPLAALQLEQALAAHREASSNIRTIPVRVGSDKPDDAA